MDEFKLASEHTSMVRIEAFEPVGGQCFAVRLPGSLPPGDSADEPFVSPLMLLEDGMSLGPAHAVHALIREKGRGLFSHWGDTLYLSSSDNSDPRRNGREYHVFAPRTRRTCAREKGIQAAVGVLSSVSEDFSRADAYAAVERCLSILYPEAKMGEEQKSFWHDAEFIEAYRSMCGSNYRPLERKYAVFNLLRSLYWADGDIAECGVYNGSTAYYMALANEEAGGRRGIFLYDSFEGLSQPSSDDGDYWRAGDFAIGEDAARKNLGRFRNVHFRRGWIPERFGEVANRTFCFVHVDVDLYQPTLDSIEFFFPRLQAGGMLVCDDYGFETCRGARRAMDEFFTGERERIVHLPTGQGLVIKL